MKTEVEVRGFFIFFPTEEAPKSMLERECCLLVLNLVSSTLPCIRQPRPRLIICRQRRCVPATTGRSVTVCCLRCDWFCVVTDEFLTSFGWPGNYRI